MPGGVWFFEQKIANIGNNNSDDCLAFAGTFVWTYVEIIGLKTLGNYYDQFSSNKMLVLFCEGPNDFWICEPQVPLFMYYNIPKTLQRIS